MSVFKKENVKLGISPIAWSNDDMHELGGETSLEQCLFEAKIAGYSGIELGHKFPREPKKLKQILSQYDLSLVSGWHSTFFTQKRKFREELNNFKNHLSFLKAMGCDVIICAECNKTRHSSPDASPRQIGEPLFSDKEWKLLAERLNEAGRIAKDEGLKLVYHHHRGTGVEVPEEIDKLMETTDSGFVYLLGDTGHMLYGGGDPVELFKKHADRIGHVHLKDIRKNVLEEVVKKNISFLNSVRMGMFTVPGDGCINYEPIFDTLASVDYSGWLLVEAEQDPEVANPLKYAKKSMAYIKEKTGI